MKLSDFLYISYQNFKNRKSRVFFTILGVSVAIAVVLSLVSFGYGLQRTLLNQITTEESLLALDVLPSDPDIIRLNKTTLNRIASMPGVKEVSPQASFNGQVSFGGINSEAVFHIVEANLFSLDGKSALAGELFHTADQRKVVVNSTIAELFYLTPEEMLGKSMNFTVFVPGEDGLTQEVAFGSGFVVSGVIESTGGTGEIYIHDTDFTYATIQEYQFAKVKVADEQVIGEVRDDLINMGFLVSSLSEVVTQANKIFSVIQAVLGIFGVFALVVAGIGLVNTMTISLLERTNEIGIMRAIGASPSDIRKIFLGEAILIGFLGGVAGIIFGIVGSELLNWAFNLLATSYGGTAVRLFIYPLWFLGFIVLLSTSVGFLGGIWPAKRAASMNPLRALRYK